MRGEKLLIVLSLLFCLSATAAPQLAWDARYNFGLPTNNHQVVAMTLDNAGDIIIAGNQTTPNGDPDYVVLKYSQTGTQHWARTYSSGFQAYDQLRAMAVDSDCNVYVTGSRTVKYNRDGQLLWAAPYGGLSVAVDSNRFVYVVGVQVGDFLTVKLAPNGTNVWLRTHDRPFGFDIAWAVALGPAGEVYVGGTVTWALEPIGTFWQSHEKFAVVKYDAGGTPLWVSPDFARSSYSGAGGEVRGFAVLGDRVYLAGNFWRTSGYVTGAFDSEVGTNEWSFSLGRGLSEDSGMTSMVVSPSGEVYMTGRMRSFFCRTVALSISGTERWHADFGTPGTSHRGNGIALDSFGSVFIAGQFPSLDPDQNPDFLIIKYDNDGHELWQKRYNGPANRGDIAIGIAVTPDGGIFVAGQSANTNGGTDITLLKYIELENIQWLANGTVLLQFPAPPGQSARFQASTNLTSWENIATVTASPEGIARYTDTTVSQHPLRFYRLAIP